MWRSLVAVQSVSGIISFQLRIYGNVLAVFLKMLGFSFFRPASRWNEHKKSAIAEYKFRSCRVDDW